MLQDHNKSSRSESENGSFVTVLGGDSSEASESAAVSSASKGDQFSNYAVQLFGSCVSCWAFSLQILEIL